MKQTTIYKLNPTKEQEGHLHNLCSIKIMPINRSPHLLRVGVCHQNVREKIFYFGEKNNDKNIQ